MSNGLSMESYNCSTPTIQMVNQVLAPCVKDISYGYDHSDNVL